MFDGNLNERLRAWRYRALFIGALAWSAVNAYGQGCVVAHGSGMPTAIEAGDADHPWDLSVSYRWFKSDRYFVGVAEQTQRQAKGDQVINRSIFVDATVNYAISPRYSASLTIPYVNHDRSQVVKDSMRTIIERYSTQATGVADISLLTNAWIWDPANHPKGNDSAFHSQRVTTRWWTRSNPTTGRRARSSRPATRSTNPFNLAAAATE